MHNASAFAVAAIVVGAAACGKFDIPNVNSPSIDQLETNPTPSVIAAATQGLIASMRSSVTVRLSTFAHYGREGYYIDVAQTRLTAFDDVLSSNDGLGGGGWATTYQHVKLTNAIRHALDQVTGMTDAQKEATRGFVKTAEAYLLHGQLRAQDVFGIAVATDVPRSDPPAPVVTKAQSIAFIVQRLDEAKTHLLAGGTAFPFSLGSGFTGFNTPVNFLKVNRALRARVAIEAGDYAGALTALGESFIDPAGAMSLGAYNVFSTASGDITNPYFDPSGFSYVADSFIPYEAQLRASGEVDLRSSTKTAIIRNAAGAIVYRTHTRVTSDLKWTVYATNTSPIPLIKNEELLLIRAEAKWKTGDPTGALADLNIVRTTSGGLTAIAAFPGDPAFETELLYNRRYSLLFEYGHRWVDLRRFNRLGDLHGPRGAGDLVFDKVPIPQADCDARSTKPAGCTQVNGVPTTS